MNGAEHMQEEETVTSILGIPRESALVYRFARGGELYTPSFSSTTEKTRLQP